MSQPAQPVSPEYAKAEAAALAHADAMQKDDTLARAKGASPEQLEARKRAAALFCEIHFPDDPADQRAARLAAIDYARPIATVNARGIDLNNPKAKSFFGPKPAYLVSPRFPPATDDAPVYALEYFPLRS